MGQITSDQLGDMSAVGPSYCRRWQCKLFPEFPKEKPLAVFCKEVLGGIVPGLTTTAPVDDK